MRGRRNAARPRYALGSCRLGRVRRTEAPPICCVNVAVVVVAAVVVAAVVVAVVIVTARGLLVGRCREEYARAESINRMCPPEVDHWRLIIPVKGQATAKSRLHPPLGVARADLAHALALDTITAAAACLQPHHLFVVTSDGPTATFVRGLGGTVIGDLGHGLNPAISLGIAHVDRVLGPGPTAVLLGDLPALRTADLVAALAACADHSRALVPDAEGTGTVLLSALSPGDLHPRFGPGSALAHGPDYVQLNLNLPSLRTDVDDDQGLRDAMLIGVGRRTALVLGAVVPGDIALTNAALSDAALSDAALSQVVQGQARDYRARMQASVHRYDEATGSGSVLLDDGREIPFDGKVIDASGLRLVRSGQRVSIEMSATELTRLWIVGIGDGERIR